MIYDFAIIGNGIIGTILSAQITKDKKFSSKSICFIGPKNRSFSASLASGAMHAVFGEVEHTFKSSEYEKDYLKIGIKSRSDWKNLVKNFRLNNEISSNDTIFYTHKNKNQFEIDNFNQALEICRKFKCLKNLSEKEKKYFFQGNQNYNDFEAYRIKNEYSLNVGNIINKLDDYIKTNKYLSLIDDTVTRVDKEKNIFKIYLKKKVINARKVICVAGYGGSDIKYNFFNPIPVVKGVGTAFVINTKQYKKEKCVIRTPNRGGSQCGLHVVPLNKNFFYVGAGNYLSTDNKPIHRLETIKYLINLLENELISKSSIYSSSFKPLLGYRARSLDSLPSIGSIKGSFENFYFVSGCNRVGLTWSSFIVKDIMRWLKYEKRTNLLKNFKPDRKLNSYGSKKKSENEYVKLNIGNLIEHSIVNKKNKKFYEEKLRKNFHKHNTKINQKYISNIQLAPDLLSVNLSKLKNI